MTPLDEPRKARLHELLALHAVQVGADGALAADSLTVVLLIEDIERELDVRVPAAAISSAAFSSFDALCALVASSPRGRDAP